MSSANFTRPAHLERPSTLRTGVPTTRKPRRPGAPSGAPAPAWRRLASMERLRRRPGRRVRHPARRQLDGLEDLDVARAAAEVSRERLADLVPRRCRAPVEERLGGAENPRGAVATLGGAQLGEGGLERMGRGPAGQSLDGHDRAILALEPQHEAGELRLPVEQDGAGPALPKLAAVLGSRQA